MKPSEFLDLGERLIRGESACERRTGLNRLYLANHLAAIHRVAEKWSYVATADAADHGRLIQFMHRHGRLKVLASMLDELRDARLHADYHLHVNEGRACEYCEPSMDIELQGERLVALGDLARELQSRLEKL